jgi:ferrochelatase
MRYTALGMISGSSIGIVLVNTGTPDAPTREAVTRYLRGFLLDRRIVNIPPLIWKPILYGVILKERPKITTGIYRRIWTPEGSPYTLHMQNLGDALASTLASRDHGDLLIRVAHRYGNPSMEATLQDLQQQGVSRVVILPLYPQQAFPTTGSVHDELLRQLSRLGYAPEVTFIWDYYRESAWIQAVAASIRPHLTASSSEQHLLFSFHSEPLRDGRKGDPYRLQVEETVASITAELGLSEGAFSIAYQSRFHDTQRWLGPFLPDRLVELRAQGVEGIRIVCPGFAVDCTETLYDLEIKLKRDLLRDASATHCTAPEQNADTDRNADAADATGIANSTADPFAYIPCLNASPSHVDALAEVIENYL